MLRRDGSIRSANVPSYDKLAQNRQKDYGLYRCMVMEVYYTDDPKNKTFQNKQVTYDAVIIGGAKEGQIIKNIKAGSALGGEYNYSEKIYRKLEAPLSGAGKKAMAEQKGDIVYVEFLQGDPSAPVIIACGTSPLDLEKTGATKADGPRWVEEYNGVFKKIDKLGNLSIWIKGGIFDEEKGILVPTEDPVQYAIQDEYSVAEEKHTQTFKSGLKVETDGLNDKVVITTKAGAKVTVDGKTDTVELKDKGTGKLKITGNKVAIGANGIEVLAKLVESLTELATVFGTVKDHMHLGNLGYPTAPPDAAFISAWNTAKTNLEAIKAELEQIKGTL